MVLTSPACLKASHPLSRLVVRAVSDHAFSLLMAPAGWKCHGPRSHVLYCTIHWTWAALVGRRPWLCTVVGTSEARSSWIAFTGGGAVSFWRARRPASPWSDLRVSSCRLFFTARGKGSQISGSSRRLGPPARSATKTKSHRFSDLSTDGSGFIIGACSAIGFSHFLPY